MHLRVVDASHVVRIYVAVRLCEFQESFVDHRLSAVIWLSVDAHQKFVKAIISSLSFSKKSKRISASGLVSSTPFSRSPLETPHVQFFSFKRVEDPECTS